MAWLGNLLGTLLSGDSSPDRIIEVKLDKYSKKTIIIREESIFLYDKCDPNDKYEILMHKPFSESLSQSYSLYRADTRLEGERHFSLLKDKLPLLCKLSSSPNVASLQKFCAAIKEHPSWNICHLVVYFNFVDCLQDSIVASQISSADPLMGVSPLQLAVKYCNLPMVVKLVHLGAALEHLDHDGNNIYHYAANTNKDILMNLVKEKEGKLRCIDGRNQAGQTPLHVACFSDKPDCVKALLVAGADVNLSAGQAPSGSAPPGVLGDFMNDYHNKLQPQEMKYGGTPLHWSSSKEVIDALLDCNCNINAVNFDSRTALHVMVMKNRLECVVALLSREAEPSHIDADGNTPLHLAVKERNISIIQALIVFGADLSLMNNVGDSPRHLVGKESKDEVVGKVLYTLHAVGAKRCPPGNSSCGPGCTPNGTWDGIPLGEYTPHQRSIQEILEGALATPTSAERGGRMLCLDGGGIRGLVLVVLLLHLEAAIARPIIHCFDWLAATSTGAILALALAAGKSLQECLCLYFRMKDIAFAGFRPYSSEPLETILKETLGTESKMSHVTHPKLMITGCLADRKPVDLHLFRNYSSPDEILGSDKWEPLGLPNPPPPDQQLLWEAARASGAAPSYFRAFGRYVDGGLISNNPTLDAITEIHEYNTALEMVGRGEEVVKPSLVVSIGTGSVPITQVESMDIFWPSGIWDTAKLVSGVRSMQAVLVDQATQADGRVIDRTRAICSMIGLPYFRFSPQMSEDIVMDEKSDIKLVNLLWETKAYMTSQQQMVNNLASMLSV